MKDSKLYDIAYLLSDLIILNILWIIFSLPLITVFASTEGLFYSIHKLREGESEGNLKEFWKGFKKNIWWTIINFIIALSVITILYIDVRFFLMQNNIISYLLSGLILSFGLMFLITLIYTLLMLPYYNGTFLVLWKNSFLLGLGYLPKTALILFLFIFAFFVVQFVPISFFIILISGLAYILDIIFSGIIKKHIK